MQKVGGSMQEVVMEHGAMWSGDVSKAGAIPGASELSGLGLPLVEGALAPQFSLPNADMETFELEAALAGKVVVLHFYPRNAMPSSTRQAISFSDHDMDFARFNAVVVGISLDECLAHADFRDEHGIAMELLSDVDGEVCRRYGVWQERVVDGVARPTVVRSTFVIGNDGLLRLADYNVDVRSNHTAKLLELLKSISVGSQNGNRQEHSGHA